MAIVAALIAAIFLGFWPAFAIFWGVLLLQFLGQIADCASGHQTRWPEDY